MKAGNVPTAEVGPVIAQLIEEMWPAKEQKGGNVERGPWGYSILAEICGISADTIYRIVAQRHKGVSFDVVDKVLCALGRPDIWQGQLHDVYHSLKFPPEATSEHIPDSFACGHSTERDNLTRSGVKKGVQYFTCATCQREAVRRYHAKQRGLADAA